MKEQSIQDIRAFNRFYTDIIGLLNQHLLNSSYPLAEVRIMYEIHSAQSIQASQIMTAMQIDKSYLSRLLKKLEKGRLIIRKPSAEDARAVQISLTAKGEKEFEILNQASNQQIGELLKPLSEKESDQLAAYMKAIMNILKLNR